MHASLQSTLQPILKAQSPFRLSNICEGYQPWLLAAFARESKTLGCTMFIARDDAHAALVAEATLFFAPELDVRIFPAWDCLPYDRASPATRIVAERLSTLAWLLETPKGQPRLLVTTLNAITQRVLPSHFVKAHVVTLKPGQRWSIEKISTLLNTNGYTRTDTVAEPGDYAVRGGLVDLYPAGETTAIRLDFFGDELESIRRFDPADQRSIGKLSTLALLPVSEVLLSEESIRRFRQGYVALFGGAIASDPLYQAISEGRRMAGMEHWLPLFNPDLTALLEGYQAQFGLIILDEQANNAAIDRFEIIEDYYQARLEALNESNANTSKNTGSLYKPLSPASLYLTADAWNSACRTHKVHTMTSLPAQSLDSIDCQSKAARNFTLERLSGANVFEAVRDYARAQQAKARKVVLVSYSEGARARLQGLLHEHGFAQTQEVDSVLALEALPSNTIGLAILPLEHGFATPTHCFLTEQDILGERLLRKRRKVKSADTFVRELASLSVGDLVVHRDHGIGRFEGLQTISAAGAPHDCICLSYAEGDKLYVPVENIDSLTRYGSQSDTTSLDRLGGVSWQSRKARLKARIKEIAGTLMQVAAARALREAPVLEAPAQVYEAFCARFPYVETEDQARAIASVIEDLTSGRPMDRLICGDVGFGKTEVALRAACIAALAGQQVALICPTTLLARQHLATFQERFKGLPVRVGGLSRLISSAEQSRTKASLRDGTLDIVVGTHALLGKTIDFKRLGLVIVDEEQYFGVTHKERLKQLRADVHVLTLTATPIPRTLQMALTGLRELSVIATPPIDRLAVRTYVIPFDALVIREALLREHHRGGQSFFICPRVADLPQAEELLASLVPEVKVICAHGQMAPSEIEERMTAFVDRRYDVLLSTTIIESGIDIPSANTLIIQRADMFGLAQLYQLRGRVGRSKARAYAYLTTPANQRLSEGAHKRLHVLSTLDSLGAGFQLASHDLDIRGAGNLLGDEQSGHIREVGFELYQQMLEEAIEEARAQAQAEAQGLAQAAKVDEPFAPQISVNVPILLPEVYVPDLSVRMALYRRVGDLTTRAEIESFAAELIDRFGKLPQEVKNLLMIVEIKQQCRAAGISKIEAGPRGVVISFQNDQFANPAGLIDFLTSTKGVAKFRPDQKLVYAKAWGQDIERLRGLLQLARTLAQLAHAAKAA